MHTQSCNCTCLGPGFKAAHVPNNNTCFGTLSLNCICLDYSTAHALDHSIMQLHMSRTSYAYMPWTTQSCSCICLELLMPTCLGPLNHAVARVSNFLCLHALDHSIMQLHMSRTSCAYMPTTRFVQASHSTTWSTICWQRFHPNANVGKFKEGDMPLGNPVRISPWTTPLLWLQRSLLLVRTMVTDKSPS